MVVLHSAAWGFLVQISGVVSGGWVIVRGVVALVRVFAFAMYRVGLAAPQLNWVETWNNLELAIFTGTRRATFSLCLSRGIGSLIKIML